MCGDFFFGIILLYQCLMRAVLYENRCRAAVGTDSRDFSSSFFLPFHLSLPLLLRLLQNSFFSFILNFLGVYVYYNIIHARNIHTWGANLSRNRRFFFLLRSFFSILCNTRNIYPYTNFKLRFFKKIICVLKSHVIYLHTYIQTCATFLCELFIARQVRNSKIFSVFPRIYMYNIRDEKISTEVKEDISHGCQSGNNELP